MDRSKMAAAFNEWMRRFIEAPERFAGEWEMVKNFQAETADGKEPSYGEICTVYLEKLMREI